ncbi:MAG TPA: pantoate--beta-alanine ligase [Rhodanobacteraceae bacterium]
MQTVIDAVRLRAVIRAWRGEGRTVGLVPTMGNLHEGHYALIKLARSRCEQVVASVFVNPTQFGPNEDFDRYPRTLDRDQAGLAGHDCDLLFAPSVEVMYPFGPKGTTSVHVPGITEVLEGACRPGHFDGVTTVVSKLFHLVQPDVAVFGQKDFQQLRVIERMVRDLALPISVVGAPIRRESDGLAMSSRNQYLSDAERQLAPQLYTTLRRMRELHLEGHARAAIEKAGAARLARVGFEVDYIVIRRAEDLAEPAEDERDGLVALAAARLGGTRLIDNLPLS